MPRLLTRLFGYLRYIIFYNDKYHDCLFKFEITKIYPVFHESHRLIPDFATINGTIKGNLAFFDHICMRCTAYRHKMAHNVTCLNWDEIVNDIPLINSLTNPCNPNHEQQIFAEGLHLFNFPAETT